MKNIILLIFILVTFLSIKSHAQDMGVGFILGEPTGLSLKKMTGTKNAVDAGLGWSFRSENKFNLFSDYLFIFKDGLYWNETPLDVYLGVGGRMKFADDIELGVRGPVGLSAWNDSKTMEFFGEVAPILDFVSDSNLELNLGLGARYYF